MARIPVTPDTVAAFLSRHVRDTNYHFFYGLHLLGHDRFTRVADGLLNGDFQPEELIRLGAFTDAEADAFLEEVGGHWVGLGRPGVGSDAYAYLTRTLGLADVVRAAADAIPGPNPHRVAGIRIPIGGTAGHATADAVRAQFGRTVLPAMVAAGGNFLPTTGAALAALGATALFARWADEAFGALIDGSGDPAALFLGLGDQPSGVSLVPGLLQWIAEESRPSPRIALMLRREAAQRSALASPVYGPAELEDMVAELEASSLSPVGTSRIVASLDFRWRVASAALAGGTGGLVDRAAAVGTALDELHAHRDRLRSALRAMLATAPTTIYGHYPAT